MSLMIYGMSHQMSVAAPIQGYEKTHNQNVKLGRIISDRTDGQDTVFCRMRLSTEPHRVKMKFRHT